MQRSDAPRQVDLRPPQTKLKGRSGAQTGQSNGEARRDDPMDGRNLYWGEIHTHTDLSDGNGSPEDNFEIARSHLDFWAMADHTFDKEVFDLDYREMGADRHLLNERWQQVQELCRAYEKPGAFAPILAYEWTNFQYGHHNVYYLDYDQPLRMPPTLPELYQSLEGVEALVIPHHTGYAVGVCGKNWDYHDERLSPFVEIYSMHGSSEEPGGPDPLLTAGSWMGPGGSGGSVQEGLARGYRLGIMASSDSHGDHPGAYDNGLIAAYAEELTRQSLWKAFREKRIYGVTGDRIGLDFSVNGEAMGGTIRCDGERRLEIKVKAWDQVERVDVIRNNALLHSFVAPGGRGGAGDGPGRIRFFVEWGWDRLKSEEWAGRLMVKGGRIVEAAPCFRGSVSARKGRGITGLSGNECRWLSHPAQVRVGSCVRAFADALAFDVECGEDAALEFAFACGGFERTVSMKAREILEGSTVAYMERIPPTNNGAYWHGMESYAKFKIHQGRPNSLLDLELELADEPGDSGGGTDFYYVRVIQKNGQRAWSSPVWVEPME